MLKTLNIENVMHLQNNFKAKTAVLELSAEDIASKNGLKLMIKKLDEVPSFSKCKNRSAKIYPAPT